MNQASKRDLDAPSSSHDRVWRALEKLLKQVDASKLTGEAYLRLVCYQGGVRDCLVSVEGKVE